MNQQSDTSDAEPSESQDGKPSGGGVRRTVIGLLLLLVPVAVAFFVWNQWQSHLTAAEAAAKSQLQKLGVLMVAGDSGQHVGSANLTLVRGEEKFSSAVELVKDLRWLQVLDLSGKPVTAEQLAELAQLNGVKSLHLANTPIDDAAAESLARFSSVSALHLSGTNLTGASLEHISRLGELSVLDLSDTGVSGDLAPLASLANLQWLVLRGVPLEDAAIETFAQMPALKRLTLEQGQMTEDQRASLRRSAQIQVDGVDPEQVEGR